MELRAGLLAELQRAFTVRAVGYPNRALGSLDDYHRFAASEVGGDRLVLVAESFSGLVAARWAARDPRVVALVLCGAFARNPVGWASRLGASLPAAVKLGPRLFAPFASASGDPARRAWAAGLDRAVRALSGNVVAERLRLIAAEDVSEELAALRIPIVLVQFDGDLVIAPRVRHELEAVCHNARVVRIPGPHFALETLPRECAAAIAESIRAL